MKLFKNILLRIPYVTVMVLPYVFAMILNMWVKAETEGDALDEFMEILLIFSLVGALVVNARVIISSTIMSFRESSIWNLVTKIVYAPVHIYIFSLCDFDTSVGNGFIVLFWVVFFVFSFDLMSWTGAANIATCAKGYNDGKLSLRQAVVMIILSYVYVVDIVCAIVQVVKSRNREQNRNYI